MEMLKARVDEVHIGDTVTVPGDITGVVEQINEMPGGARQLTIGSGDPQRRLSVYRKTYAGDQIVLWHVPDGT